MFFLLLQMLVVTASAQCVEANRAIRVGESLKYSAYYNWGFIWVKGGVALFEVAAEGANYKFTVSANSLKEWRWVYDLDTKHTALMDSVSLKPVAYYSETKEDGNLLKEEIVYDGNSYSKRAWRNGTALNDTVVSFPDCSWDIINAVYTARNMDVSSLSKDETVGFDVIYNDAVHRLQGRVLGREVIKAKSGKKYDCFKCSTTVGEGTIFASGEPVFVWITADSRQIPVLVESKIRVGSIKVYLDE